MHNSNAYLNKFYCLCLSHIQKNMNRKSFHENCCTDADIHDGSTYTHHDLKSKSEKVWVTSLCHSLLSHIALVEGYPPRSLLQHSVIIKIYNEPIIIGISLESARLEINLHHLLGQTSRAVRIDYASSTITNGKESD